MVEPDETSLSDTTGLAIALIGMLLEGGDVLPKGDFSRHLANLAIVTQETYPVQGDLLARWAALAAQVGRLPQH